MNSTCSRLFTIFIVLALLLGVEFLEAASSCSVKNPSDSSEQTCGQYAANMFCPSSTVCCTKDSLRCSSTMLSSTEDEPLLICGEPHDSLWCGKNFGIVQAVTNLGEQRCLTCRSPEGTRMLADSCEWKASCASDEVLQGVWTAEGLYRCCTVQSAQCAPKAAWSIASQTSPYCHGGNVLQGAAGFDLNSCSAFPSSIRSARYCAGFHLHDAPVASTCAGRAQCLGNSVAVGYGPCPEDTRLSVAQCATLRAGQVMRDRCFNISGNSGLLCPRDYAVTEVCAPAFRSSCEGKNTLVTCCPIATSTTASVCTVGQGWEVAAGEPVGLCPTMATNVVDMREMVIEKVTAMAFNSFRNVLMVFAAPREENEKPSIRQLVSLPVEQHGATTGKYEGAFSDGPTGLTVVSPRVLVSSEFEGSALRKFALLASGRAWSTGLQVGYAGISSAPRNGSDVGTPISPARGVVFDQQTQHLFFSTGTLVYRAASTVLHYAGGHQKATLDVGSHAFRTEFALGEPRGLVIVNEFSDKMLFICDQALLAVYSINMTDGYTRTVIGVPGEEGHDSCSATTAQQHVKMSQPRGIAFAASTLTLYVADAGSHCVRGVPYNRDGFPQGGCEEVGRVACGNSVDSVVTNMLGVSDLAPDQLTTSTNYLYISSTHQGSRSIFRTPIAATYRRRITATRTRAITSSIVITTTGSENVSLSESQPLLPTSTTTISRSESKCAGIKPVAEFWDLLEDRPVHDIISYPLQHKGVELRIRFLSCHKFTVNLTEPTWRYNETQHPNDLKVSVYGFQRFDIPEAPPFSMKWVERDDAGLGTTASVTIGPWIKYHPTIEEWVELVWPAEALEFSDEDLVVGIHIKPKRVSLFDGTFATIVGYGTFISAMTSFFSMSPMTSVRVAKVNYILRLSECPIEDIEEPLPFSIHPVGVPIGIGSYKYHIGAVLCNTCIILFLAGVNLLAGCLAFVCVDSPKTKTLAGAFAFVRFPSLCYAPLFLLLQPTLRSALKVIYYGGEAPGERGERTMTSVVIACTIAVTVHTIMILSPKRFGADPKTDPTHWMLRIHLIGRHRYKDKPSHPGFVAQFGALFKEYRPERTFFFTIEAVVVVVVGALDSISLSSQIRCTIFQGIMGLGFIIMLVILQVMKPYQSSVRQTLFVVGALFDVLTVGIASTKFDSSIFSVLAMICLGISAMCLVIISGLNSFQFAAFGKESTRKWWGKRLPTRAPHEELTETMLAELSPLRSNSPVAEQQPNPLMELPQLDDPSEYERVGRLPPAPPQPPLLPPNMTIEMFNEAERAFEEQLEQEEQERQEAAQKRWQRQMASAGQDDPYTPQYTHDFVPRERTREDEIMALI